MNTKKYYGIMKYSSINIGDEIQSVAAMRFLPKIDEYVHREKINSFQSKGNKKVKLIMNAWWMWQLENFPPSENIEPLLISMYIRKQHREKFLTPKVKEYFLKYGPVGCRDQATAEWLNEEGIPAYFSGCLTLTLERNRKIKRENHILCVDCPKEAIEEIKRRTKRPVYSISRMLAPYYTAKQRLEVAKIMLKLYQSAFCVVSPRLHVVLPCLALQTPVLRIIAPEKIIGEPSRYSGYENFIHTVNIEDFIKDKRIYNFAFPPKNPNKHMEIRKKLIDVCSKFTGFDNKNSIIDDKQNSLIELIKLSQYKYPQIKRLLYWAKEEDMEEIIKLRGGGVNKHDLEF